MTETEFLEQHVFIDLINLNTGFDTDNMHYFSETDFDTVLKRITHFGIGIYTITTYLKEEIFETFNHEAYKKKATDTKWYTRAFLDLKKRQDGLIYGGTYKVSKRLLERS